MTYGVLHNCQKRRFRTGSRYFFFLNLTLNSSAIFLGQKSGSCDFEQEICDLIIRYFDHRGCIYEDKNTKR